MGAAVVADCMHCMCAGCGAAGGGAAGGAAACTSVGAAGGGPGGAGGIDFGCFSAKLGIKQITGRFLSTGTPPQKHRP